MPSDERSVRKGETRPASVTRRADCSCLKEKCERHGDCAACSAHHAGGKSLPFCKR